MDAVSRSWRRPGQRKSARILRVERVLGDHTTALPTLIKAVDSASTLVEVEPSRSHATSL